MERGMTVATDTAGTRSTAKPIAEARPVRTTTGPFRRTSPELHGEQPWGASPSAVSAH